MDREAVGTGGALPSYIHESHVNGVTFFFSVCVIFDQGRRSFCYIQINLFQK